MFRVASGSGRATLIASFDGTAAAYPSGGLAPDAAGNLYGTTSGGGAAGVGTIFKLAAGTRQYTPLTSFTAGTEQYPQSGNLAVVGTTLYGVTAFGGTSDDGTLFSLPAGATTPVTLASFAGPNGSGPSGSVVADARGNLFGTTEFGGAHSDGSVFEFVAATQQLITLASFDGTDGDSPYRAGVLLDAAGNLYGTTENGGTYNEGTVYRVDAATGAITNLVSFDEGAQGGVPLSDLYADAAGNLYGTTLQGGDAANDGTLFEVTGSGCVNAVPEPNSLALAAAVGPMTRRRRPVRVRL